LPCFFYVTFTDKIVVYYNVKFNTIPGITLTDAMQADLQQFVQKFQKIGEPQSTVLQTAMHADSIVKYNLYKNLLIQKLKSFT